MGVASVVALIGRLTVIFVFDSFFDSVFILNLCVFVTYLVPKHLFYW